MSTTAVHRATHVTGIAPQFLVDDLDRAIAYYCDKLGFELDFKYQSFYASVSRDGFSIHLKEAPRLAADREFRKQHEHLDAEDRESTARFENIEIRALAEFLLSRSQPFTYLDRPKNVTEQPSAERGQWLFESRGCLAWAGLIALSYL